MKTTTNKQDESNATGNNYVVVATKINRTSAEQLARIAKAKGLTIYELIQMVCDTLIRYMDDSHNLTVEMEQAMRIFEHMIGWADALNLADPTIRKEIVQAVYIFQDADGKKHGLRASMVTKPFIGLWGQTENVMTIFENMFNILMPDLFTKLTRAKIILNCNTVTEVVNMLADAEVLAHLDDEYRQEFEDANRVVNKDYAFGNRTVVKHHRTPDSVASDLRIKFADDDRAVAEKEACL